jgi:hypothetical protein
MKIRLECERRGERALARMAPEHLLEVLFEVMQAAVAEAKAPI